MHLYRTESRPGTLAAPRRGGAPRRGAARLAGLLLALGCLIGVPTVAGAASCSGSAPPTHLDAHKQDLVAYGCSGDYGRDLARAIAAARPYVEARAGEVTRPALVLDIDETSLSNWRQLLANDFAYVPTGPCRIDRGGPCSEIAWQARAEAVPIVPMLALYRAARARGVAVFFLSGRRDGPALRAATARNLQRAGYRGWTALIMRAPDEHGLTATAYKSARRAAIAAQGYTIIASIGDQWSDLDGGAAERTFKLPNPFYTIP